MLFQPNSKFPTVRKISFVADSPINRAHQRTGERTRVSMKHEKVGFHRYLDLEKYVCKEPSAEGAIRQGFGPTAYRRSRHRTPTRASVTFSRVPYGTRVVPPVFPRVDARSRETGTGVLSVRALTGRQEGKEGR